MAVVEVTGLTHRYGRVRALSDVSLAVPDGAVYALIGPNGAGKTTLLRILSGLLRPTSGRASLLGTDVRRLRASDRMSIGYVAEGQRLPGWMRLGKLEAYLAPLYPSWDHALADDLRARFRLDPDRRIRTLSRGEHMKAALLCTLAPRPRLLLMDEPFTAMDALVKDELVRGLLGTAAGEGLTVLISSHDLAELEPLADHVGFLDDGGMLLSQPMDELRARFRHVELVLQETDATAWVPDGVLAEERAGRRITFIHPHADDAAEAELRARNDGIALVDTRPATLRELFVALAREGGRVPRAARQAGVA
jgi:ABC-2 type transport system ATP-binding protein